MYMCQNQLTKKLKHIIPKRNIRRFDENTNHGRSCHGPLSYEHISSLVNSTVEPARKATTTLQCISSLILCTLQGVNDTFNIFHISAVIRIVFTSNTSASTKSNSLLTMLSGTGFPETKNLGR